jgi:copper chaperone NosL
MEIPTMMARWLPHAVAMMLTCTAIGCARGGGDAAAAPREVTSGTACSLDGMLLGDYPGPKAQIHYAGSDEPDYFCDLIEMFRMYLKPEQVRGVRALYVQDMGNTDWERPRGQWVDARTAFFVVGSRRHGSMGPTIASFALEADARRFVTEHGGRVLPFGGVKAEDAVLDGGALHDGQM